jgi:membrane-bound lytic murein transglycosylase F
MWKAVPDPDQRMKFTLASYNAGPGHIIDAQNLAKAAGLNPHVWDGNVEVMVGNLDDPTYYRSEHVRCGAYRGHAVSYVKHVFGIYNGWR